MGDPHPIGGPRHAKLHVEPAFALTARAGRSASEAQILPSGPLSPGVRYRFGLPDPTGPVIGTWSYRTAQPLLTYSARVVSPETFTWEPAVVQSTIAARLGASTPVSTYTIR